MSVYNIILTQVEKKTYILITFLNGGESGNNPWKINEK